MKYNKNIHKRIENFGFIYQVWLYFARKMFLGKKFIGEACLAKLANYKLSSFIRVYNTEFIQYIQLLFLRSNSAPKPHNYTVCFIKSNGFISVLSPLYPLSQYDLSKTVTMENFLRPAKHFFEVLSLSYNINFLVLSLVVCVCIITGLITLSIFCCSSQDKKDKLTNLGSNVEPRGIKREKSDSPLIQEEKKKQKNDDKHVLDLGFEKSYIPKRKSFIKKRQETVTLFDRNDPTNYRLYLVLGVEEFVPATLSTGLRGMQFRMRSAEPSQNVYKEMSSESESFCYINIQHFFLRRAGVSKTIMSKGAPIERVEAHSGLPDSSHYKVLS